MTSTLSDYPTALTLPADDGTLEQAISDLDTKFEAWSGAIVQVQSELKKITPKRTDRPVTSLKHQALPSKPSQKPPTVKKAAECVEADPKPAPEVSAKAEEDEALLASLDPDTAKRIQVLRRIGNRNVSVRELLEKHNLNQPAKTADTSERKSFWRR